MDWVREEPDDLITGSSYASQNAEGCRTTLGDSQLGAQNP